MTEGGQDSAPRPALQTLQADQRELISGSTDPVQPSDKRRLFGLREGFPDRRAAVDWYQRAIVRTWGYVAELWHPADLARDRTLLSALITGPERSQLVDDPLALEATEEYRRRLERQAVLPACDRAYNTLRKSAGEYIDSHDDEDDAPVGDIDPENQDHVAMRPAFQWMDRRQAKALNELWGGFRDEEELMDWLHDLAGPANGAVNEKLPAQVGRDPVAMDHLLEDDPSAPSPESRRYRERFVVHNVLPAFANGIARMSAGELAQRRSGGLDPVQG